MSVIQYDIGDMVFATEDILNDGGMPGVDEAEGLIAPAGARGVVVHYGHSEVDPSREIYLVRFETGADGSLGSWLKAHLARTGLSQAQAAKLFGVTQPRVSDLMRGKINLFGLDALVNMVAAAGMHVEMRVLETAGKLEGSLT